MLLRAFLIIFLYLIRKVDLGLAFIITENAEISTRDASHDHNNTAFEHQRKTQIHSNRAAFFFNFPNTCLSFRSKRLHVYADSFNNTHRSDTSTLSFSFENTINIPQLSSKVYYNSNILLLAIDPSFGSENLFHGLVCLLNAMRTFEAMVKANVTVDQFMSIPKRSLLNHNSLFWKILDSYTGHQMRKTADHLRDDDSGGHNNIGPGTIECFRSVLLYVNPKYAAGIISKMRKDEIEYKKLEHHIGSRNFWRQSLGMPIDLTTNYEGQQNILVVNRPSGEYRKILNLDYMVNAAVLKGWNIQVLELENLSLDEQFRAIQNASTIIGYHGAGLSWARFSHPDSAEIQVIGLPCSFESHSSMHFKPRYKILHSDISAISSTNRSESEYEQLCKEYLFNKDSYLTGIAEREGIVLHSADVRKYNAIVNIKEFVSAVETLDPIISRKLLRNK